MSYLSPPRDRTRQSLRTPETEDDLAPLAFQSQSPRIINNYHGPVYNFHGPTATISGDSRRNGYSAPPTILMRLPPKRGDAGEGYSYVVDFGTLEKQESGSNPTGVHSSVTPPIVTGMVNAFHNPPPNLDDYLTGVSDGQNSKSYEPSATKNDMEGPRQTSEHERNNNTHLKQCPFQWVKETFFRKKSKPPGSQTGPGGTVDPNSTQASKGNVGSSPKFTAHTHNNSHSSSKPPGSQTGPGGTVDPNSTQASKGNVGSSPKFTAHTHSNSHSSSKPPGSQMGQGGTMHPKSPQASKPGSQTGPG
ncbi:hypothetical protein C0995_013744, partial [Termitomyces sp. Mi166